MAELCISYSEAKRRLSVTCDHYLMVGDAYDGGQVVFCPTCDLPADAISAFDAEPLYLGCEVHSLSEARLTGNMMQCMNASPLGDEGDGTGQGQHTRPSVYPPRTDSPDT